MSSSDGSYRQRHLRRCPRNPVGPGWAPHKCRGRWQWTVDLGPDPLTGKRRQETKGGYTTLAEAKAALDGYRDQLRITGRRGEALTVAAWLESWLAGRHDLSPTTRARYESAIRLHLIPLLGRIRLPELAPEHVDGAIAVLADPTYAPPERVGNRYRTQSGLSSASVNRILDVLQAALNTAVKRRLIAWSPMVAVTPPEEINAPGQAWTPQQTAKFLSHVCDDAWYAAWRLVLVAGARRGEVAGVRWADIDLDHGLWVIATNRVEVSGRVYEKAPKARRPRLVYLDGTTLSILRAHHAQQVRDRLAWGSGWTDSGRVVTRADGSAVQPEALSRHWRQLVAASGLPPIRLHDGRHTAATLGAVWAGVDDATMRSRIGHTSAAVAERYRHPHEAVSRDAARRIAEVVDGAPKTDADSV
jgi:integrase